MNSRMYARMHVDLCMYVGVHACICVGLRLANAFINVKPETK